MKLGKNKKLFQIKYKNCEEPETNIYNMISLRSGFPSREFSKRSDVEVIEYDLVEVGRIPYKDLETRFPNLKKR